MPWVPLSELIAMNLAARMLEGERTENLERRYDAIEVDVDHLADRFVANFEQEFANVDAGAGDDAAKADAGALEFGGDFDELRPIGHIGLDDVRARYAELLDRVVKLRGIVLAASRQSIDHLALLGETHRGRQSDAGRSSSDKNGVTRFLCRWGRHNITSRLLFMRRLRGGISALAAQFQGSDGSDAACQPSIDVEHLAVYEARGV